MAFSPTFYRLLLAPANFVNRIKVHIVFRKRVPANTELSNGEVYFGERNILTRDIQIRTSRPCPLDYRRANFHFEEHHETRLAF